MSPLPPLGVFAKPAAVASGSFESIATVTVGSGGASSISFTSIPSTYTHLQIRFIVRSDSGGYGKLTFNSDTTGSNYYAHDIVGGGSAVGANAWAGSSYSAAIFQSSGIANASNTFLAGVMDILDYTSTSKNKTFRVLEGYDQNGSGAVALNSGLWSATPTAITSITLAISSGSFQNYSHFALYGIKSA